MSLNLNDIEEKGRRFALQVTAAFVLFLVILCLAIRIKPKVKYQELAIRLDSVPVVKEKAATTKKSEPVKAKKNQEVQEKKPDPKPEPKKQERKADKKVEKAEKKPEPAKKKAVADSSTPKKEEPKIRKSMEQLMAENKSAKKKKVEFDESLFADETPVQTKESSVTKNVAVAKSSLSGSSASAENKQASGASSSSSSNNATDNSVSNATKDALSDIKNTVFSSTVAEGIKSKTSIAASRNNGVVSMQMSDGSARQLLYPKSPSILISEENAKLIDSTRNVTISFIVKDDGSVPFSDIEISPSSSIPAQIQREIKEQIKTWQFSEDASGKPAKAVFNYSLEIK